MTGRSDSYIKRVILCLLILSGLALSVYSQDKKIRGVINVYKKVVAIGPGFDNVTLNSVAGIAQNDTVLLIQMQGVRIVTDQGNYGSTVQNKFGEPGGYEFLIVSNVDTVTYKVVFRNNILNTFDLRGNVQLVRVPYYNSATIDSTLTVTPWDATQGVGGVLTMIVGRKLKLNADIDVSGKGFIGGKDTIGKGECVAAGINNNLDSYPRTWDNAGYKGEGLALHDDFGNLLASLHAKGQGINFTGGGGGNGKYSGGGGGSNRGIGGIGGDGGREKNYGLGACLPIPSEGAFGGTTVKGTVIKEGLFFGGGGGTSTHAFGSNGSSGGNGGGIVIIIADTISGSRNSIKADGATAGNAISDGGAGGGGAGGSVILSLQSYSNVAADSLKISVKGGNGGTNIGESGDPGGFGNGGGGGGGLIWVSTASIPGEVPSNISYGIPGNVTEGNGEIKYSFSPILNGFLFNSILSEVTGNQIDSICSDVMFGSIIGTKPVGGVEGSGYHYNWQYSTVSENEVDFRDFTVPYEQQNYTPSAFLTQTTWFRRIVTDNSSSPIIDKSKPVKVIVQPLIQNNIVGTSDTICSAQDPLPFISKAVLQDGNGKYTFKWEVRLDSTMFASPSNNTSPGYTPPPALKATSWYRRTVTSGRCVDTTAIVKITVLPLITNDSILSLPQDICFGTTFTNLIATTAVTTPALAGGDNKFRFKWESNINGTGWSTAPGVSDKSVYDPTELPQNSPMNEYYFRRIVNSGYNDVCTKTSNTVLLRDYPVITSNTITANDTICSGSAPAKLIGTTPNNGNGIYSYTWQDSSKAHTWTDISGAVNLTTTDYSPPSLTDTTSYRRIVNSTCTDISKSITVIVHKPILDNHITLLDPAKPDTTICDAVIPHRLNGTIPSGGTGLPGGYAYLWFVSINNSAYNAAPGANTNASFQPASLSAAIYYYKRQVISGACTTSNSVSDSIKITVLPLITNNSISGKATVCYNTVPNLLSGSDPLGGNGTYTYLWEQSSDGGATWGPAALVNNTRDYQSPALNIPMKYRRTVKSGASDCCTLTSAVFNISIDALPTGAITSTADTIICEGSNVSLRIHLTGATPWQVIFNENSTQITKPGIAGTDPAILFTPVTGAALTTFNYSLFEVKDQNNCIATSISGARKADVYKIPKANAGPDADACGVKFNLKAVPSVVTGTWYYPAIDLLPSPNNPYAIVTIDSTLSSYSSASGTITHKYIWEEVNWQCKSKDSVNVTFEKRVNTINAGKDTSLYTFDNIFHMSASKPNKWETGKWSLVTGAGVFSSDTATLAIAENLSKGLNSFLWSVHNGSCKNEDMVNVNVYQIVIPEGFSPNNDNFNNTFIITGLDLPNQKAELKIINGAGAEVYSTFKTDDVLTWKDWDGKNSNGIDLPEGTYYYLLKITSIGNGQVFRRSGFIVLKRY